jgi:hypothetical protein
MKSAKFWMQTALFWQAFMLWGVWAKVACCCADMGFTSLGRLPLGASLVT